MEIPNQGMAWDTLRRQERAKRIAMKIRALCKKSKGKTAFEFGCGTGLIGLNLSDLFCDIVMMDISKDMLDVLTEKVRDGNLSHLHPVLFDLTQQDYPKTFDVIFSSMALHHVQDLRTILFRFERMLTPGGTLCFVDLDTDNGAFHRDEANFTGHHGFSHNELNHRLKSAGFRDIEIETFYWGEKITDRGTIPYSLFYAIGQKL